MQIKKKVQSAAVILMATLAPAAFAVDDVATAMAGVQTTIAGYIAAAGIAGVSLMTLALGWDVGMTVFRKFFKKGAR